VTSTRTFEPRRVCPLCQNRPLSDLAPACEASLALSRVLKKLTHPDSATFETSPNRAWLPFAIGDLAPCLS
jgi:hypothetical protein